MKFRMTQPLLLLLPEEQKKRTLYRAIRERGLNVDTVAPEFAPVIATAVMVGSLNRIRNHSHCHRSARVCKRIARKILDASRGFRRLMDEEKRAAIYFLLLCAQ